MHRVTGSESHCFNMFASPLSAWGVDLVVAPLVVALDSVSLSESNEFFRKGHNAGVTPGKFKGNPKVMETETLLTTACTTV